MAMYHAGHPDGSYQMANQVQVFDPPHAISWEPGQDSGDGDLRSGGLVWLYDLAPAGPSGTTVTLSHDRPAVPGTPSPPASSHRHRLRRWQKLEPARHRVSSAWMLRGSGGSPARRPPASGPGSTGHAAFQVQGPRPATVRSVRAGPRRSRNWPVGQLWPAVPRGAAPRRPGWAAPG
jgi:hypothetical protein